MPKVIALGNCLAQRLTFLLEPILEARNKGKDAKSQWELVKVPPVYNLPLSGFARETVAELARQCDVVFSQPLFNFGELNTSELRKSNLRLHTFSAPNFDAYFPDIIHPQKFEEKEEFPPPMEWHSRIFLEFKAANGDLADLENYYLAHPIFREKNLRDALERSWAVYERRERDVEIGTLNIARDFYASEILFYTWKHPADRLIRHILAEILRRLDFGETEVEATLARIPFQERIDRPDIWSYWGFGFNSWPVISRHSKIYSFPGREFFRVSGQRLDILTAGLLWFKYYDEHPLIFEKLLKQSFSRDK